MEMEEYLKVSEFIDWQHPEIMECAKQIASGHETPTAIAKACFEWVRDEIRHSYDYQMSPVTRANASKFHVNRIWYIRE